MSIDQTQDAVVEDEPIRRRGDRRATVQVVSNDRRKGDRRDTPGIKELFRTLLRLPDSES